MTQNPPISLVKPSPSTSAAPPRPLGAHGMDLWTRVTTEYRITDCGGVELLAQACAAVDRIEELDERIAGDGSVIYVKGGPRMHPAIKEQLALRAFVCRTLQRLGLNLETVKPPGRPGGWGGAS